MDQLETLVLNLRTTHLEMVVLDYVLDFALGADCVCFQTNSQVIHLRPILTRNRMQGLPRIPLLALEIQV